MNAESSGANEERAYFLSVLSTFRSYREQSLSRIKRKETCLDNLPYHHKQWLKKYKEDLEEITKCIEKNSEFIPLVLRQAHCIFENAYSTEVPSHSEQNVGTLSEGLDKVQSVFKQLMRDWSSLGALERKQCYQPIFEEIFANYPEDKFDRSNIKVLVPGAGLGRLAFEIASRGFFCQGNEFNLFMLIVSFFVLNLCKKVDEYEIYPWIHQYCNNLKVEDQMLSVRFPDVIPTPTPDSGFSMTAGDFLEVYTHSDEWHCVATCFFIDCAPNVVQFIEKIYLILKPGGLWVNLGPLLYHYSDMKNEKSVEPSFQVVMQVIKKVGFELEKCETDLKTKYCQNPKSMLQYEYDSVFFVCRKPISIDNHETDPINGYCDIESSFSS
ncbi:carnosine N-methyltransferase [Diorhabda carinulata]|uniref:carnosine N-methyltransferase n=1 Tax=Diorhabda sublineata TaxID=1163346 RepID=UPI0024E18047|nr:carnosine N-methyltransferase [Diorhabda sublineata]XP_057655038.1 carnosine N-methyltransferase [Diorhabda carinulata]